MSGEQAIADFVCRFVRNPRGTTHEKPRQGRVVMSRKQLVIATDDERVTTALSDVVDIVVGNVPPDLRDLFDSTITIGYKSDDGTVETLLIEAKDETISRFGTIAFKALLNGSKAKIKHPAQIGGRVTDATLRNAKLTIEDESVTFQTSEGPVSIDITTVIDFQRANDAPDGSDRSTLIIKHADNGQITTSLIVPFSTRRLNLLGRFLRIRYSELLEEAREIDLDESQTRLLVAIYTAGGDIDFTNVLDGDAARATNVLNALREKGLIKEDGEGLSLTSTGQVIVSRRLESVNM